MAQWMQHSGWDVGYTARARRYLRKAERLRPEDSRLRELALLLDRINSTAPGEEAPAS